MVDTFYALTNYDTNWLIFEYFTFNLLQPTAVSKLKFCFVKCSHLTPFNWNSNKSIFRKCAHKGTKTCGTRCHSASFELITPYLADFFKIFSLPFYLTHRDKMLSCNVLIAYLCSCGSSNYILDMGLLETCPRQMKTIKDIILGDMSIHSKFQLSRASESKMVTWIPFPIVTPQRFIDRLKACQRNSLCHYFLYCAVSLFGTLGSAQISLAVWPYFQIDSPAF